MQRVSFSSLHVAKLAELGNASKTPVKANIEAAEERARQAVKRAEEAEAKPTKSALDAKEVGNKCDALIKRCQDVKEELRTSRGPVL